MARTLSIIRPYSSSAFSGSMLTAQMFEETSLTSLPMRSEPSMAESRSFALHIATSTRLPCAARLTACAAQTVVLPTPPLPVTIRNCLSPSAGMVRAVIVARLRSATFRPRPSRRRGCSAAEELDLAKNDLRIGPIATAARSARDLGNDVLPYYSLPEDRVFVVEPGGGLLGDEELRAVGRRTAVRHRHDPRPCVPQLRVKLVLEAIARTSSALSKGAAALDHEVRNDAMEDGPRVERNTAFGVAGAWVLPLLGAGGQTHEVLDRVRGALLLEAHHDVAERRVEARVELAGTGDVNGRERGCRHDRASFELERSRIGAGEVGAPGPRGGGTPH